jgi:hypothetical protein
MVFLSAAGRPEDLRDAALQLRRAGLLKGTPRR